MLLNEQDFMKPMKLVYQVRVKIEQNPKHVKAAQALTLNQSKPTHGLNGTYGLYGSAEWLNNLELGVIPHKKITGLIVMEKPLVKGFSLMTRMICNCLKLGKGWRFYIILRR